MNEPELPYFSWMFLHNCSTIKFYWCTTAKNLAFSSQALFQQYLIWQKICSSILFVYYLGRAFVPFNPVNSRLCDVIDYYWDTKYSYLGGIEFRQFGSQYCVRYAQILCLYTGSSRLMWSSLVFASCNFWLMRLFPGPKSRIRQKSSVCFRRK
jgi:hypothetical protein